MIDENIELHNGIISCVQNCTISRLHVDHVSV